MRTWTLGSTGIIDEYTGARIVEGPSVMPEELPKVIELDRILDLLENLAANFAAFESQHPSMPHCRYIDDAKRVLKDNGRL